MLEINFKNPGKLLYGTAGYGSWQRLLQNELRTNERLIGVRVTEAGVTYFTERVSNERCN